MDDDALLSNLRGTCCSKNTDEVIQDCNKCVMTMEGSGKKHGQ